MLIVLPRKQIVDDIKILIGVDADVFLAYHGSKLRGKRFDYLCDPHNMKGNSDYQDWLDSEVYSRVLFI